MSNCNNTPKNKLSENIKYDGPALACSSTNTCDDLNTILEKINNVSCNLIDSVSEITETVNTLTENVNTITINIINIFDQLEICCPTTTTTTTIPPTTTTTTTTVAPTTTTTTSSSTSTTTTTTTANPTTTTTTTTVINYVVMELNSCGICEDQPTNSYIALPDTTPLGTVIRTSDLYCWVVSAISTEPVDNTFLEEFDGECAECQEICPIVDECYNYKLTYDASGGEVNYIDCFGSPQNIEVFGVEFVCARSITSTVPAGLVVIENLGSCP